MTSFPPSGIETGRLVLRIAEKQFADALLAYRVTNRDYLQPWEPLRDNAFFTTHASNERMASMEREMRAGTALHLLVFSVEVGNPLIGDCHFTNIVRGPFQACHLGYSIDARHEGRGLMSEALRAAIAFVFRSYRLHRVMASYRPENARSGRLLDRLGFEREGLAKSYLKIDGAWADHVLTARINPDDSV